MEKRYHFISIFYNLLKVLYLIVLPVLRGFFSALLGRGLAQWARGAWFDISVFLAMVALAVLRWYFTTYRFDTKSICLTERFLLYRKSELNWERVTAVSITEPFYLRPLGVVALRVDTLGGSYRKADISIYLNRKCAEEVVAAYGGRTADAPPARSYIPSRRSIASQALLSSNSLGGILFAAAFISQLGKLFGSYFSDVLLGTLEETARTLAFGIPPAAAAIGYILLLGWGIGVMMLFLRYRGFTVSQLGDFLDIRGGAPTKRSYRVRASGIAFVEARQTLLSAWLGFSFLSLSAVGYGKHADDIACVFPAAKQKTLEVNRAAFFPGFIPAENQLRPLKGGMGRFLLMPAAAVALVLTAMAAALLVLSAWQSFVLLVGLMALVPALVLLGVRLRDYRTGGASLQNGALTLRYSTGFTLNTAVIPLERVVAVRLRQSFFQRRGQSCDLEVYTVAERRVKHLCRSLDHREAARLLGIPL